MGKKLFLFFYIWLYLLFNCNLVYCEVPKFKISKSYTTILSSDFNAQNTFFYSIYIKLENEKVFIVSPNTLFLLSNKSTIRADRIYPLASLILSENNSFKSIKVRQVFAGEYIDSDDSKSIFLTESNTHIKIINQVLFPDSYLQKNNANKYNQLLPQVATVDYVKKYKAILKDSYFLYNTNRRDTIFLDGKDMFIKYSFYDSFNSDKKLIAYTNSLYPIDNVNSYIQYKIVINKFTKVFDNIKFIDIPNDIKTINAFADGSNNTIKIYGGIIFNRYILEEGLELIIAHEVAHLLQIKPYYGPFNVSCEGQADYWATKEVLRKIYNSTELPRILKGIDQFTDLNICGYAESRACKHDMSICTDATYKCDSYNYPCLNCRIITFLAGYEKKDKPLCAGKPSGTDQ
jgi:hypothetical protein